MVAQQEEATSTKYDAVVIGTGQSGPSLVTRLVREGLKAAVVERKLVGRARERSETRRFMKVRIDAETKNILGAAVPGIGRDEIVQSILDVMYADAPQAVVQRAVHIHPTVTEPIPAMLGNLKPLD